MDGPPGWRRRYHNPIILQRVGLLVRVPYDADDPPGERTASIEWIRQVHRRLLAVIGAIFEPHITFRRKLRSLADAVDDAAVRRLSIRSEENTSELQSLMRISYAVFCLKKKKKNNTK